MGSDMADSDYRSRRRKYEDDDRDDADSSTRRKRYREDEEADKPRRRERSTSRSRRSEHHHRSRTPDADRRRKRERSKDRDHDRTRHRDRDSSRGKYRDRSKDGDKAMSKELDRSRHHRRRGSSRSPDDHSSRRHRHRHRHRSPSPKQTSQISAKPTSKSLVKRSGPLPDQDASFAVSSGLEPEKPKEQPNFAPTGVLAAAANSVTVGTGETVTLKYHEPPEARKPPGRDKWKLFVFKGPDVLETIELSLRSCWLVGRDRAVVDLPAEHPSISKQHAVLQFRWTEKRNEFGDRVGRVKPYLIDLESANGTVLNGERVPESRYLEIRDKDVLRFGLSEREYVVMLDRE